MLQRFFNKEMTKRQTQQLNDFLNLNDALSQTIKDTFKARPEQYRHLDFTNYLVNAQGTFDDNTLNQVRFTPESKEHYKKLLKDLQKIEKLQVEQKLSIPSKFKNIFKISKKGSHDVKS